MIRPGRSRIQGLERTAGLAWISGVFRVKRNEEPGKAWNNEILCALHRPYKNRIPPLGSDFKLFRDSERPEQESQERARLSETN